MLVNFGPPGICLRNEASIYLVPPDQFYRYFRSDRSIYWSPRTALRGTESHVTPASLPFILKTAFISSLLLAVNLSLLSVSLCLSVSVCLCLYVSIYQPPCTLSVSQPPCKSLSCQLMFHILTSLIWPPASFSLPLGLLDFFPSAGAVCRVCICWVCVFIHRNVCVFYTFRSRFQYRSSFYLVLHQFFFVFI